MTARAAPTAATRIEALREQIGLDAPEMTHRIREAAAANQGNEARFRTLFAQVIEPWARALDIPLLAREERTLATGRADATYNRLVIEYEAPGRLRDDCGHGATAHAIQQAKDYVEGVARAERQQIHRLIGVVIDGCYFIYVRKVEGHWTDPEVEPVNEQSVARFLRLLVSLTSGKALLPENLLQDFGSNTIYAQRIASSLYQGLSRTLDDGHVDLVDKLFEQWQTFFGEVTGYEEGSHPLRNRPELRQFARGMGLDVRNVDPPRLFFTVHTYFALLIKLIAYYALSRFVSGFGTRFGSMYHLDDDDLKREMQELERGGIFRTLGIRNFLEGDFFKWYLDAWDTDVARAVRTLLERLKDYDPGTLEVSPEQARDLLKRLYHGLMPRELRHDLGEFYTPDWLAEHVLNEVGYDGDAEKRLLDPACGSGTFLVLAIRRLRERCFRDGRNEQETLALTLRNIAGIDLNPLAVIAARTNFVLALGDLLVHRTTEIDLPIYLADSILTPASGGDLFRHDRYELKTVVGDFDIPSTLNRREQIDALCHLLEECVAVEVAEEVFLVRTRTALGLPDADWLGASGGGQGEGARSILQTLYRRLTALHAEGLDGIWARILQNAFMPLFLGEFDIVAGNPPWVNWASLPEQYRQQTRPLWLRYQLFPHSGMDALLGRGKKDLSMLMTYVVIDRLLKPQGLLGFVITQSLFQSSGAGEGFRRFRFGDRDADRVRVISVDDMSRFQPFESASNRTAVVLLEKGTSTNYPVPYRLWQKTARGETVGQDATLTEVKSRTRRLDYAAEPVVPNAPRSAWVAARPEAIRAMRRAISPSHYEAHAGCYTGGANGVYWVRRVHDRPDGLVVVQNMAACSRQPTPEINAEIESALLFPLLRGRDVAPWRATPSATILLSQDPATRRGIPETQMQRQYPRAFAYLARFREQLARRRDRGTRQIIESGGAFYSVFGVGPYTVTPWKVVWKYIARTMIAAVVGPDESTKPIVPDHRLMLVACMHPEEAHFLCAVLNSSISRLIVQSHVIGTQISAHVLEKLGVPCYDAESALHVRISALGQAASDAAAGGHPTVQIEADLDAAVGELFGLAAEEVIAVASSLAELAMDDVVEEDSDDERDEPQGAIDIVASILGHLAVNGPLAASDLVTRCATEIGVLRRALRTLEQDGRVIRQGRGRGTVYCARLEEQR